MGLFGGWNPFKDIWDTFSGGWDRLFGGGDAPGQAWDRLYNVIPRDKMAQIAQEKMQDWWRENSGGEAGGERQIGPPLNPEAGGAPPGWVPAQSELYNLWRWGGGGEPGPTNFAYQALYSYLNDPMRQQVGEELGSGAFRDALRQIAEGSAQSQREGVSSAYREGRRRTGEAVTRQGLGAGGFGPSLDIANRYGATREMSNIENVLRQALAQAELQDLSQRMGFATTGARDIADLWQRIGQARSGELAQEVGRTSGWSDLGQDVGGGVGQALTLLPFVL